MFLLLSKGGGGTRAALWHCLGQRAGTLVSGTTSAIIDSCHMCKELLLHGCMQQFCGVPRFA